MIHNYLNHAGKVFHWDTSDNESQYLKNIKEPKLYEQLLNLGFVNTQIEYRYNSHGFRTDEFDDNIEVLCFGCSFTMGTGVHAKDSWPSQFAYKTGLKTANLGLAGSSNDTVFRLAHHYLPSLKPKYALWVQTDMSRIEILEDSPPISLNILAADTHNPYANDEFTKVWFSVDSNQELQLQKNTLAFQMICRLENIIPIIIPRNEVPFLDYARDLMHPGKLSYQKIAETMVDICT
jgi:hypothetical protein